MPSTRLKQLLALALVLACVGGGIFAWRAFRKPVQAAAFASGNGRIEATEVSVSTKLAGRLVSVRVKEGDDVAEGQVLARMDTKVLQADLREAEAAIAQRRNEIAAAEALVAQRGSQLSLSTKELKRSRELSAGGFVPDQKVDVDLTATRTDAAQVNAARAQLQAARAAVEAATARAEMIRADLQDATLTAPTGGRVLYRLAEPGEVLAAGGPVVTLLDLSDVYMTIFLPTEQAGQVALGAEARIVLDVRPDLSIPAQVSFVSPEAQFTPKAVETRTEREKLMFRVKVRIPEELLKAHAKQVKTGLPGVAHVRLDPDAPWPPDIPPLILDKKPGP